MLSKGHEGSLTGSELRIRLFLARTSTLSKRSNNWFGGRCDRLRVSDYLRRFVIFQPVLLPTLQLNTAVDDGTGVIDCNHKIVVPKVKNTAGKSVTSSTSSALPELPKPVATVGDQIYAVGRATVKYGERQSAVNQLGKTAAYLECVGTLTHSFRPLQINQRGTTALRRST